MVNNLPVTPGSGATVATDDVAGVHYQLIKIALGDEDAATRVTAANGLPVEVVAGTMSLSGEDHIGEVGFSTAIVSPTFTMDISPDYASGDVYGDKTTLTNAMRVTSGGGVLGAVSLTDSDDISPEFQILLWDSDPTNTTWTDNSPPTINVNDLPKLLAKIPIVTADWTSIGGFAFAHLRNLNIPVRANGSAHLYLVLIASAVINVATAGHLKIRLHFVRY